MPGLFLSPAFKGRQIVSFLTVPLTGTEAKIYNEIWHAIMTRGLRPGVKLDEIALCDIYGVSRTIVRRALVTMEQDGLVTLNHNRGASVAAPSLDEGEKVLEAIAVLYVHFAKKLAQNPDALTEDDRNRLNAHLDAEESANQALDFHVARRLRGELGILLGLLSGNLILAGAMARYMVRALLALSLYQRDAGPDSNNMGRKIYQAILNSQVEVVIEIIATYSTGLMNSLKSMPALGNADLRTILRSDNI
ncbi:GntR family transcriptional regulator [Brucella anthropi]|uniref:GntR family transcriptional regulator n=1 Tax=Brucella anthropi TaxID=529 RepID=UPI000695FE01|nr:GntR family transcriptional regulator [Brucella anthropi]